jgi:LysR family transcriptional regulator, chromosome initiation inhibitor
MFDYPQLSALAAVVRTGSFERAAQQLHVTPSAVSQRIKLLEERLGTVLVVQVSPARQRRSDSACANMLSRLHCSKAPCMGAFRVFRLRADP